MGFLNAMDISASGLTAQRMRMDIISQNIANASVTRTADGTPYRRQVVMMAQQKNLAFSDCLNLARTEAVTIGRGVQVTGTATDMSDFTYDYDPEHPDANEEGYVAYPNVDELAEMVDMMAATRAYEANVTALNSVKAMATKALEIGR